MRSFTVRLMAAETCGGTIGRFRFERPEGYDFVAGQHMTMTLDIDVASRSRVFTIASTPSDEHLEVCTRLTGSDFKNALIAMNPGMTVRISAPSGVLHLAEGATTGFLVGGVGVTPAHSMILDAMSRGDGERLLLFYGDRSSECMTYSDEFMRLSGESERFVYVPVVEHPDPGWTGDTGFITATLVRSYVLAPGDVSWIVAGSPVMSGVMGGLLDELGVPASQRQQELFSGYAKAR